MGKIILGSIWFALFVVFAIASLPFFADGSVFLLLLMIAILGVVFAILWNKHTIKKGNLKFLNANGFTVNKEVSALNGSLFVDDVNKKIAISIPRQVRIINFSDIVGYELNENGNSIMQGRGLSTAVGGAFLGTAGALMGAAGARKSQSTCRSLIVRIMVNDLNNPQILLAFVRMEKKTNSIAYQNAFNNAKEAIAVLSYIENQQKTQPDTLPPNK